MTTPDAETRCRPPRRELVSRVLLLAFLLCGAAWLALLGRDPSPAGIWINALLPILAALATVAGLARNLPIENSIMAAVFVAVISGLVETVGTKAGVPFGPFTYMDSAGPQIFHLLPWFVPVLWVAIILNSRDVARLIMRPWRKLPNPGFWVLGLACFLAVVTDLNLEPLAAHTNRYWIWQTSASIPAWYSAPWINFPGWAATALLILVLTAPWLINKNPVKNQAPNHQALILWLTINLLLTAANASQHLWRATAAGLITCLVVAALAMYGLRSSGEV